MEPGWHLNAAEERVLGALMEKHAATPEYYPLSLAALEAACNQKSSREPVTNLNEDEIRLALRNLQEKGLAEAVNEGRVPKFRHRMQEALNPTRGQAAVLCLLLLRGAQTPGELRGRSGRLHAFADLEEVERALEQLEGHAPPMITRLPRLPGTKETRYAHLLGATRPAPAVPETAPVDERGETLNARVARLEAAVAELRSEVARLREPRQS